MNSDVTPFVTVEIVARMFPFTPVENIRRHLPTVIAALRAAGLRDRDMVLTALATIRAETESFLPDGEPGNASRRASPDDERYNARGFLRLVGRDAYAHAGQLVGMESRLLDQPELAADPTIAARVLAASLKSRESQLRAILRCGDVTYARTLVSGRAGGLDRFRAAWDEGLRRLPDIATIRYAAAEIACTIHVEGDRIHVPVRCVEALTGRSVDESAKATGARRPIDVEPLTEDGEVWAWIRPLAANFGLDVAWDGERRVITLLG